MTDSEEHVWRDEERLPLTELERAMGASTPDGQVDDVTGNEAGAESAFGHGAEPDDPDMMPYDEERAEQMSDDQRRFRPSTTGRTGPH
ncbi:hypothetical protein ACN27G_18040 [Plantactinospora sp. WMMB334]|uniref:hypothetical protein n=1 Tax=Plantactinospora sp. WMMB334 TaxID=3404119 RepID=UPI003B92FA18